jgi:ABC-type antimicrobial peptide transport system permease subunit
MQFFMRLKPGTSKAAVEKVFPSFIKKYFDEEDVASTTLNLQPLAAIHFDTSMDGYINKKYLWALALIGLFLVITACLNFINMATAQAINRSKEVGRRKVLGSLRSQLFLQFLAETIIITLFALLFAYGLAKLALPPINTLFKTELSIALLQNWQLPVFLVLLVFLVVFISATYPGLVLAGLKPILALKGKLAQKSPGGISLRKSLVIVQFIISQILIIAVVIIAGQMHYARTSDLGFNKEAIVIMPVPVNDKAKMNTLRTRLMGVSGVQKVTLCRQPPASTSNSTTGLRFANRAKDEPWEINRKDGDDQYVSTFGLKLVAGRNFFPADTIREVLINETAVKKLGLADPKEAIGKMLSMNGGSINAPIAGVVQDFYNKSLRDPVSPVVILPAASRFTSCAVKMNMADTRAALTAFEKIWNETYAEHVYAYRFMDDRIGDFYELDNMLLKFIEGFSAIAILIACLGLYGLISFMAAQKTKEIGVRKVLGAGVMNIVWIFGKEFSKLLIIAFLIATPLAWYAMNKWLEDFTYRMKISPSVFLLVIAFIFVIAIVTVGYRSLKAALANPVKSLRSE